MKLSEKALQLCYAIEKLPASEDQTCASVLASAIHSSLLTKEAWRDSPYNEIYQRLNLAKNELVLAVFGFDKLDAAKFSGTIKELKQTIGDLCAAIKLIEDAI